jgi:hypothetical protein
MTKDFYGKYYDRTEKHIRTEFIINIIIAFIVTGATENLFYGLIVVGYAFIRNSQLNTKNRQLEILNRLDKIEEKLPK